MKRRELLVAAAASAGALLVAPWRGAPPPRPPLERWARGLRWIDGRPFVPTPAQQRLFAGGGAFYGRDFFPRRWGTSTGLLLMALHETVTRPGARVAIVTPTGAHGFRLHQQLMALLNVNPVLAKGLGAYRAGGRWSGPRLRTVNGIDSRLWLLWPSSLDSGRGCGLDTLLVDGYSRLSEAGQIALGPFLTRASRTRSVVLG